MVDANRKDSYSPLIFEVLLPIPTPGGDRIVELRGTDFLQSINIELVDSASWKGSIVLFDQQGQTLEDLIIAAQPERRILFRWGWDDGRGGIERYPLYEGHITIPKPEFTHEGVSLTLELVSHSVLDALLDKQSRSFPEGVFTISEIFELLAEKRGWKTEDRDGNNTVELTKGIIEKPLSQINESDIRFIKTKLVPEAVNQKGRGDYRFFFDPDGVVHFHTPDFIRRELAATYRVFRDSGGEVVRFSPKDDTFYMALRGAHDADYTSIDSLAGVQTARRTSGTDGIEGASQAVNDDAALLTNLRGETKAKIQVIARTERELLRKMTARFDRLRDFAYTAELEVRGTHQIQTLDRINVEWLRQDGQLHYLSGKFQVHGVQHVVDPGGWRTTFQLQRKGTRRPATGTLAERKADEKISSPETPNTRGSLQADAQAGKVNKNKSYDIRKAVRPEGG